MFFFPRKFWKWRSVLFPIPEVPAAAERVHHAADVRSHHHTSAHLPSARLLHFGG